VTDDTLTAVSLFAGVGGFDLAADLAGIRTVAAVEIDPHARGVLAHRFPQTHLFDDVRTVTPDDLRAAGFVPERGVIFGGFPCQDLSVAGSRRGLAGERSGLFWEIIRLIDDLAPRWVVLENVPGLLSSNGGRDMGTVVGALERRGYSVAWRVLDAQGFGVPQRRRRLFFVAHSGDLGFAPVEVLSEPNRSGGHPQAGDPQGQDAPAEAPRCAHEPSGAGDGVVVHFPTDVVGTLTTAFGEKNYSNHQEASSGAVLAYSIIEPPVGVLGEKAHTLTAEGHDAGEDGTGRGTPVVAYSIREDAKANTFSATPVETARALQAQQPSVQSHHAQTFITQTVGAETFVKTTKAKTADDSETWRAADLAPTLNTFDNHSHVRATVVLVGEPPVLMRQREGKDGGGKGPLLSEVSLTLATRNDQTLFHTTTDPLDEPLEETRISVGNVSGTIVRRLTPTECERLQGFPDGWTAQRIDHKTGQVIDQKDSARFKQMGNAVAVPCVAWILRRLVATHHTHKDNQ
jgi:DNA (cytosine-5)-methyltransferase 1